MRKSNVGIEAGVPAERGRAFGLVSGLRAGVLPGDQRARGHVLGGPPCCVPRGPGSVGGLRLFPGPSVLSGLWSPGRGGQVGVQWLWLLAALPSRTGTSEAY